MGRKYCLLVMLLLSAFNIQAADLLRENFDKNVNLEGWKRSGDVTRTTDANRLGSASCLLRNSGSIQRLVSTTGFHSIQLRARVAKYSVAGTDGKIVSEYSTDNGKTWKVWAATTAADKDGIFTSQMVTLPPAANNNPAFMLRFRCLAGASGLYGYLDEIYVCGSTCSPSSRPGMGAIPYAGGVTFRVWAPNAQQLHVAGDFNSWSPTATPLSRDGASGYWSTDVTGAAIDQQYKFVISWNGQTLWRIDPYSREVTGTWSNEVCNSIIRDRSYNWTGFTMPPWGELVVYEIHPKTWVGNVSGTDSVFSKIARKAGYLRDTLGVNAVTIMPVAEFPGDLSWGYNPYYPFAVEKSYGGYYEYKRMVNILHQHGIAVIQDIVHNHWGPGMDGHPHDLWCFDGPDFGNGGIYFYTDYRRSTPWGDTRPDYGRPEVRNYIRDNALYWLGEMNADGLRWDATVYIHSMGPGGEPLPEGWSMLRWINDEIDRNFPAGSKLSIAEDLQNNANITAATSSGGAGFDSQWHAAFIHGIRAEMGKTNDGDRDMNAIANLVRWIDNADACRLVKYSESHDECAGNNAKQRLIEDIWPGNARSYFSLKRASLALLTAIFCPGIPMLFQGQDNLETGNWQDAVDFSWDDVAWYNQYGNNYIAMIRDAIRLKRNWNNNTSGLRGYGIRAWHVNHDGKVIAFQRWENGGRGDDVVVIINFSNNVYQNYVLDGMPVPDPDNRTWYLRYNSDQGNRFYMDWSHWYTYHYPETYYEPTYNTSISTGGTMTFNIGAYSVLVYSQYRTLQ